MVQLQQKDVHDHHHYQLYESDVIQNLSEMKKQLEKLNEIEDLNISIGEFNSNMANKLDCLNGDILARLDETKDIIDNLPKNDYIYKFYKKLNELKESKSNVTLNWLSLATSLLGLSITILQYKPN